MRVIIEGEVGERQPYSGGREGREGDIGMPDSHTGSEKAAEERQAGQFGSTLEEDSYKGVQR